MYPTILVSTIEALQASVEYFRPLVESHPLIMLAVAAMMLWPGQILILREMPYMGPASVLSHMQRSLDDDFHVQVRGGNVVAAMQHMLPALLAVTVFVVSWTLWSFLTVVSIGVGILSAGKVFGLEVIL